MKKIWMLIFLLLNTFSYSQSLSMQWIDAAFSGPVFSLNVKDTLAFIGSGSAFTIADVSDPQDPQVKGHCHTTDCITYILPFGNVCYAGNNALGIAVIDITDLSQPVVTQYLFPGEIPGYPPVILGNTGYFPRGGSGMTLMDLSDPLHPAQLTSWNQSGHDFSIDADYKDSVLFLTDRTGGVYRLNMNNNPPTTIDNYKLSGWNLLECATDEQKEYLFVTAYRTNALTNDTLKILAFNIQDSVNFIPVGEFNHIVYSSPLDLKVHDDKAFVASWSDGALVINVSEPDSMFLESTVPSASQTNWIEIRDSLLYKADLSGGWNIYNIDDILNPELISETKNCGDTRDIFINGNYIYTAIEGQGVGIAEIKSDGILEEKMLWKIPGGANGVFIKDTLLFIASGTEGILVAGISNPIQPDSIIRLKHIGSNGALKLIAKGNLLVAGETAGLYGALTIWDISDILSPVQNNLLLFPNEPVNNLDWYDDNIAAACWVTYQAKSLKIVDISDPASPVILGSYTCSASDVKVFEKNDSTYAAVTIGSAMPFVANGLSILNITDPENIYQDDFYQTGVWGNMNAGVDIYNNYALTSEGGLQSPGELRVFDISNPQNIIQTDIIQIGSNTSNNVILADSGRIFHSSGSPGVMSFSWEGGNNIFEYTYHVGAFVNVYPNPVVNYINIDLQGGESATLEILSVSGQIISKEIFSTSFKKINLQHITKGIYIWKITSEDGKVCSGKLIKTD